MHPTLPLQTEGCAPFLAFANGGGVKGGANFLTKAIFRIYNKNKIEIK